MPFEDFYDRNAAGLAARYETLDPARLHRPWREFLPSAPAAILDVGAGSGRDAAWLAGLGHRVVAVEPSAAMRREARARHRLAEVAWLDDRLPDLNTVRAGGLKFSLILLNAVWMHLAPQERERAMDALAGLLNPGGVLVITLRRGPVEPDRSMHCCGTAELAALARQRGLAVCKTLTTSDRLDRHGVSWRLAVLRKPADGESAVVPGWGD